MSQGRTTVLIVDYEDFSLPEQPEEAAVLPILGGIDELVGLLTCRESLK